MTNDRHLEVSVRNIGLGVVLIGEEPVAPAGGASVSIPGATLDFDPALPSRLPSCLIADPGVAAPLVGQIYGAAVRDGVIEVCGDDAAEVTCRVEWQPPLTLLTQLAAVRFCQTSSALPLDPGLLRLEELALLGELEGIVDPDDEGIDDLYPMLEAVMSRQELMEAACRRPSVLRLLADALDILAGTLPLPDERRDVTLQWLAALDEAHEAHRYQAPEWLSYLSPELALAAGGEPLAGRATADWGDVPVGLLSRREGQVAWEVQVDDAGAAVEVVAKSAETPYRLLGEPDGYLAFDLVSPEWPLPLVAGNLKRRGADWVGAVRLGDNAAKRLRRLVEDGATFDVRVRSGDPQPMPNPISAEARRWTSRAVFALRLGYVLADEHRLPAASESLGRASSLWELADDQPELEATRELMRRAEALSESWGETLTVAESVLIDG